MARTRGVNARLPHDLEEAARNAHPELADLPVSALVRVGVAVLAGHPLHEAIRIADEARQAPGPKAQGVAA
jgi:hypothetical protein